jgi:glycerol kinase
VRSSFGETTARAAALLAGLGAGVWRDEAYLPPMPGNLRRFDPRIGEDQRAEGHAAWRRAVAAVSGWARG